MAMMSETPEPWMGEIVSVLDRVIGLDAASISPQALHHAIRAAYEASGFTDPHAFVAAIQRDERQRRSLIERVVVPETWFLRDKAPFELLARHARQWVSEHPTGSLRVLSAPCATGEEAYSIAIALLDAGIPADRFAIDAVDISERSLERARRGIYQEMALRKCPPDVRERYFSPVEGGVQVSDTLRGLVTFERRNLVGADASVPAPPYDAVFCRNLLIYLHGAAREALCRLLDRALAVDGLLIVGHAEVMPMSDSGRFVPVDSRAFALARAVAAPAPRPAPRPVAAGPSVPVSVLRRDVPPAPARAIARPSATAAATVEPPESLELARQMADQGRLDEARRICERVIAEQGPSDATFFLLGVIDQAAGRLTESAEALRKAVYLNPSNREALLQLAVVHERRGDRESGARLRRQAARVGDTQKP
jgi:chemotaxis protein methyltransferase WspC